MRLILKHVAAVILLIYAAFAALVLFLMLAAAPAHAEGRCLVIGDSIATRPGLGGQFPSCDNIARKGAPTSVIKGFPPAQEYDLVLVSAGSNDPDSPHLAADLAKLRTRLHARRLLWVLPVNRRARGHVVVEAAYSHDLTQSFEPAPDGVHPGSYPALAAAIRSKLAGSS